MLFQKFANKFAEWSGSAYAFILALMLIVGWGSAGPFYRWSDSWSLFINTATTIITFLMVFLIQSTQNRDTKSMQLKLDELIRSTEAANNFFLKTENLSEKEMNRLRMQFQSHPE